MEPDQENPQTQLLLHHHHQNLDHHQVETHVGVGINGSSTSSGKSGSSSYMCRQSSAEQIQRISARLRQYGKNIEGKNVFYWSQNHKAREGQGKRFTLVDTNHLHPMLLTPPPKPMQLQIGGGGFGWNPTHEQQHQMNIHTSTTKYMTTANISSGVSCPSSRYCSSDVVVLGTTTVGQIDCNGYGFVLMEKSFRETLIKSFQLLVFLGEHTTTPGIITTPPYSNRSGGGHGQSSGTQTQWTSNLQTQSTLQAQYNYPAQGSLNTVQPFNVIYAQPQPQYTIVPQYTKEPHLTYAVQWGRGTMSYFYGDINSINSVPKKFSNHGLYGNDIPVRPFVVLDFDPNFNGDRELLFDLLQHWRNVRKNRLPEEQQDRNQAHQIDFWRGIYTRHAREVYMTQYEYFTYTMGLFHYLDNIINHAVMEFCGSPLDDIGRCLLNVPLFLARVHQQVREYPTIHVSNNRGFQEIRELKFYLSYKSGIYIPLPLHRQVIPDYTPNHLGVAPYNPNLPLYVT